jgi:hypothetical protein
MGMFDWIECEWRIDSSDTSSIPRLGYQTKSFENPSLRQYRIDKDGFLYRREDWSMKEWEEGGDPKDPLATWVPVTYSGTVELYDWDDEGEWYEYHTTFLNGKLKRMERICQGTP